MNDGKETLYIDIDDDITSIIDKIAATKSKIVAVVLPKRSTVMHSIVNMRLLKRSTDNSGKNIVLITSEASVLPLAGAAGVYVAKTLQSKPYLPESGIKSPDSNEDLDPTQTVGDLATDDDTIQVDNDSEKTAKKVAGAAAVAGVAAAATKEKGKKPKKDKKLKVPNFDSSRKKLFIGIGIAILLVVLWYVAFKVMPKAKITITTDTSTANIQTEFSADPNTESVDVDQKIVPAKTVETEKSNTQKVATTGEKNLGNKAGGEVTLSLTDCSVGQVNIPAGTTVSNGSFNFITAEAASLTRVLVGDECKNSDFPNVSTDKVKVTAEKGGDDYNLSARTYTVSGFNNVSGQGTNMTGGTDKIIKTVTQADIDSAKQKATEQNSDAVKQQLADQLQGEGYEPIEESFTASAPSVTAKPGVNEEANEVEVTATVKYSMIGVQKEALEKVLTEASKGTLDTSKQSISDFGLDKANYKVITRNPNGSVKLSVQTDVTAGPQLNADDIKKQVAGKKRGEIQSMLNQPGVKDVEVDYSPFWVITTPNNPNKITVVFSSNGE